MSGADRGRGGGSPAVGGQALHLQHAAGPAGAACRRLAAHADAQVRGTLAAAAAAEAEAEQEEQKRQRRLSIWRQELLRWAARSRSLPKPVSDAPAAEPPQRLRLRAAAPLRRWRKTPQTCAPPPGARVKDGRTRVRRPKCDRVPVHPAMKLHHSERWDWLVAACAAAAAAKVAARQPEGRTNGDTASEAGSLGGGGPAEGSPVPRSGSRSPAPSTVQPNVRSPSGTESLSQATSFLRSVGSMRFGRNTTMTSSTQTKTRTAGLLKGLLFAQRMGVGQTAMSLLADTNTAGTLPVALARKFQSAENACRRMFSGEEAAAREAVGQQWVTAGVSREIEPALSRARASATRAEQAAWLRLRVDECEHRAALITRQFRRCRSGAEEGSAEIREAESAAWLVLRLDLSGQYALAEGRWWAAQRRRNAVEAGGRRRSPAVVQEEMLRECLGHHAEVAWGEEGERAVLRLRATAERAGRSGQDAALRFLAAAADGGWRLFRLVACEEGARNRLTAAAAAALAAVQEAAAGRWRLLEREAAGRGRLCRAEPPSRTVAAAAGAECIVRQAVAAAELAGRAPLLGAEFVGRAAPLRRAIAKEEAAARLLLRLGLEEPLHAAAAAERQRRLRAVERREGRHRALQEQERLTAVARLAWRESGERRDALRKACFAALSYLRSAAAAGAVTRRVTELAKRAAGTADAETGSRRALRRAEEREAAALQHARERHAAVVFLEGWEADQRVFASVDEEASRSVLEALAAVSSDEVRQRRGCEFSAAAALRRCAERGARGALSVRERVARGALRATLLLHRVADADRSALCGAEQRRRAALLSHCRACRERLSAAATQARLAAAALECALRAQCEALAARERAKRRVVGGAADAELAGLHGASLTEKHRALCREEERCRKGIFNRYAVSLGRLTALRTFCSCEAEERQRGTAAEAAERGELRTIYGREHAWAVAEDAVARPMLRQRLLVAQAGGAQRKSVLQGAGRSPRGGPAPNPTPAAP